MLREKLPFHWSRGLAWGAMILVTVTVAWAAPKYEVLYRFGSRERGGAVLVSDAQGNLYGVSGGGINNCGGAGRCGTVFELVGGRNGWEHRVLYRFRGGKDGAIPCCTLVFDKKGNLYGATIYGGGSSTCYPGCGTVFELTPSSSGEWTETILHRFEGGSDGASPGVVILDAYGNLYGVTTYGGGGSCFSNAGCGTVYELTPSGGEWKEKILHRFKGTTDSYGPADIIIEGRTIYGVTNTVGEGGGLAFKLKHVSGNRWKDTILYTFAYDASLPEDLVMRGGNLYGTTVFGATCGTVWELKHNSNGTWTESVVHGFTGKTDSCDPMGPLLFDKAGNLYGVAYGATFGDQNTPGNVFELMPGSGGKWNLRVLHNFTGEPNGAHPDAPLIFDGSGNLYGSTAFGGKRSGKQGLGLIFEVVR